MRSLLIGQLDLEIGFGIAEIDERERLEIKPVGDVEPEGAVDRSPPSVLRPARGSSNGSLWPIAPPLGAHAVQGIMRWRANAGGGSRLPRLHDAASSSAKSPIACGAKMGGNCRFRVNSLRPRPTRKKFGRIAPCAGCSPDRIRKATVRSTGRSASAAIRPASSWKETFWGLLDEIAAGQDLTTPKFISKLYDEALEINGEIPNFASMLRTTCALYLRGHRPTACEVEALSREAA